MGFSLKSRCGWRWSALVAFFAAIQAATGHPNHHQPVMLAFARPAAPRAVFRAAADAHISVEITDAGTGQRTPVCIRLLERRIADAERTLEQLGRRR